MLKRFLIFALTTLLSGCFTYTDKAISRIERNGTLLQGQSRFDDVAVYRTQQGVQVGKDKLSNVLGMYAQSGKITSVRFTPVSKEEFTVDYLDPGLMAIDTARFVLGKDFEQSDDGVVTVRAQSSCGSHDSPGIGCQWSSVKLFVDKTGRLVAIQSLGGAGLLGVIPVAVGADYVSVFARSKNAPTNAVSGGGLQP